ncbi:helix-turn-helix transcriptional regulator [Cohnella sp. GCM10012308]|uniref:helix-turn-helix transcriptional regulator n=1 Tax=Cohnella sp. GCM10012308 TaxID=3317329 RepID=UPI0036208BDD
MAVSLERRNAFQEFRKKRNASQRKVSLDLGVSENQIRVIESGRGNPSVELLFKLAAYFETTPESLLPDLAEQTGLEIRH